ncbi:MAG TPA: ABC transporter permease [Anaerolineae bacterium]
MLKTILNLTWKELLQLFRDRVLLVFLIVLPVSQLFLIAEATGAGVRSIKLAVWDQEQSDFSQQLITALNNTDEFKLYYRAKSYDELHDLIDEGNATVGLIIPPDFSRNAQRIGGTAIVPVIIDGTNTIVATTIVGAMQGAISDLLLQNASSLPGSRPGGIELKVDTAFNATLNFRVSTLPSQLAFITYQVVLVVAAVGLVRERELGTMEQLVVTPISRLQLLMGKALMAMLIGIVNFYFLILLLNWGFNIPMRGDYVLLFGIGILFILTEIGEGTLISIATTSQQQAILIVFLLAMLEVTFSGYLVPTQNMPSFMRFFAEFSPLQHFMVIVRAIFIKGATLPMLTYHVAMLAVLAIATTATAWVLFVRTTDW